MSTSPNFTATPKVGAARAITTNTARDGSGTLVTVFTAGTFGSRIDWIEITAIGTTTANVVRLFLNDGTNTRLLDEILVTAITPSTTQEVFRQVITYNTPLILPAGWSLRASCNTGGTPPTDNFNIVAFGGDF